MNDLSNAIREFFSQPFGVVGAVCIMLAVTAFNSRRLRARFARAGMAARATSRLLNGLNLVGGICLLINAVIRHEVVWEVLEVYFVAIAVKGLVQPDSDVESPPAAQA